jgi:hypothetical protein
MNQALSQYMTQPIFGSWGLDINARPQPYTAPAQPQVQQSQYKTDPELLKRLQAQYSKLTGQASNALYGGILGYQPQPMTAAGGEQFAAPQGNLQAPFANIQGILGRPQFQGQFTGGMGQMMQPKFNMGG